MRTTHQLVFQFDTATCNNFDDLIALDRTVERSLPKGSILDWHDCGLGEYNVFVHTNDPISIFGLVREAVNEQYPEIVFSAGYRNFKEDEYTVLWPPNAGGFTVS